MPGEIKYRVLTELPITLVLYVGEINISHLKTHFDHLKNDPIYSPEFNAITDFGSSHLNISQKELKTIAEYLIDQKELLAERKHAFIANTPNQMAITSLFSIYSRLQPVNYNVMGSLSEALVYTDFATCELNIFQRSFAEMANQ